MNKIKLTMTIVEKLPFADKGKQVDYYDTELDGFGVRVSASGKKYFVRAHIGSRRIRVMMKSVKLISAEEARREAKIKLGEMAAGIDPNEVERTKNRQVEEMRRKDKQEGITLQKALDEYLQKGKLKPRTVTTYEDLFRLYLADWLNRPAIDITRDMVKDRHREIASDKRQRQVFNKEIDIVDGRKKRTIPKAISKPKEAAADNCMRTLRAVLNYAFEDEESATPYMNPVNILSSRKEKAWFKVDRRRTLIKNSDLPAWYNAVMALDNYIVRDYLIILLFTGMRRREAATLKWSQVDFQEGCFTLFGGINGVTKNKEIHTLPLSDFLHKLLTDRKESLKQELISAKAALANSANMPLDHQQSIRNRIALAESRLASKYVFPGEGKTGFIVEPKRAIDAVTAATGIIFSCHDFRRTFATIAESLDLSSYTLKALLNHKQKNGDVTGGYIIMNVERLREPMQKITDTILNRIMSGIGKLVHIQAKTKQVQ
jgi:integrase